MNPKHNDGDFLAALLGIAALQAAAEETSKKPDEKPDEKSDDENIKEYAARAFRIKEAFVNMGFSEDEAVKVLCAVISRKEI